MIEQVFSTHSREGDARPGIALRIDSEILASQKSTGKSY